MDIQLYSILKKSILFRGRYFLFQGDMRNIFQEFEFHNGDINIRTIAAKSVSNHVFPVFECLIDNKLYFTYKSPRVKLWDKAIQGAYQHNMLCNSQCIQIDNKKSNKIDLLPTTIFQLSCILEKVLLERGIYDEFINKLEEGMQGMQKCYQIENHHS
jgi:hypothetical protein